MSDSVGRNDPCPCGSGRKYKHCCGAPKPSAEIIYVHPAKQNVDVVSSGGSGTRGRNQSPGRPYGLVPLGLPALVNLLRKDGRHVVGVNYPMEKQVDPAFDLRRWLGQHRLARMVLVDLHWYEHAYGAISVADLCKEVLPDAKIVLGGLTASGFPREILENFTSVDCVVRGDAELPLRQLARHLFDDGVSLSDVPNLTYREGEAIRETPLSYVAGTEELDRLDFADVSFLDHAETYLSHEYIVSDIEAARRAMQDGHPFLGRWIATARGCKFECSYCGGCKSAHKQLAGREGLIPRSPQVVVDELARLAERGVHQASLSYDIAEMGRDYWRRFFSLMRKRDVKISLYNEFFQLPEPAFLKHFARSVDMSHSCLALSPLTGNERVRRLNGKRYSDAELINVLDYLNLYNVPILVYFSLNLPGEDETTVQETIDLAERIYNHYPSSLLKILSSCHTMDPFSPMQQNAEKFGIEAEWATFMDFYTYCRETQFARPEARTGAWRGFEFAGSAGRSVEAMADAWDAARRGREASWWPIPPSW
jgi:radical SAM superfamily enzyme YgiQ (UPF0313 family)